MSQTITPAVNWLRNYYFTRAAFAVCWVAAAFTLGQSVPELAGVLLIFYPAFDAAANWLDAGRNGGLARNKTQAINLVVSALTAVSVATALCYGMNAVLAVIGAWASLAGILQLATALRRWKSYGAQWAMILSGAQSALVGAVFLKQATGPLTPTITTIAPYAAFGAFYFLISTIWLTFTAKRRLAA